MKKSRIIVAVIVLIVSIALVCVLPCPTHIEVKMSGSLLYGQETVEEPVYVTVQGYILDYLFLPDRVDFQFLQSGLDDWIFTNSTDPDMRFDQRYGAQYIISSCGLYKKSENRMGTAYYAFSVEDEMLLIYIMDDSQTAITCSANGEKTPTEIAEYFSVFVDAYSIQPEIEHEQQDQPEQTTKQETPKHPWIVPEFDTMDYEEFFSQEREHDALQAVLYNNRVKYSEWFAGEGESRALYGLRSDEDGLYIYKDSRRNAPFCRIPNTEDLTGCNTVLTNTREIFCTMGGKLLRVDMLTGERNTLYTAEYIPDMELCNNDVLYFLALSDGILSLNRLYAPTMTLDVLYARTAPEVPASCYDLYAPTTSRSTITWETINPIFWQAATKILDGSGSEYSELSLPCDFTIDYITAHPFENETLQYHFAKLQDVLGLRPRMKGYYDPVADTYDEKYGIYDICFFGTGIHGDEEHFESDPEYRE